MSSAGLNFTSLAANAVVPVSGHNYQLENLGYSHWLDDNYSYVVDGNPLVGYYRIIPKVPRQILTYPSSDGDTVFTLQVLSTLQSNSDRVIGDRGGYMRADLSTKSVVQGGQPQVWKLMEVSPSVYKITPFEDSLSDNGTLFATDTLPIPIEGVPNTLRLLADESLPQQLWAFLDLNN